MNAPTNPEVILAAVVDRMARRTCADDWHMSATSSLDVRFVMAGDVQILEYNDIR